MYSTVSCATSRNYGQLSVRHDTSERRCERLIEDALPSPKTLLRVRHNESVRLDIGGSCNLCHLPHLVFHTRQEIIGIGRADRLNADGPKSLGDLL